LYTVQVSSALISIISVALIVVVKPLTDGSLVQVSTQSTGDTSIIQANLLKSFGLIAAIFI
jgi:hypothetical protein